MEVALQIKNNDTQHLHQEEAIEFVNKERGEKNK
jgi:hypothetical protein